MCWRHLVLAQNDGIAVFACELGSMQSKQVPVACFGGAKNDLDMRVEVLDAQMRGLAKQFCSVASSMSSAVQSAGDVRCSQFVSQESLANVLQTVRATIKVASEQLVPGVSSR